MPVTSEVTSLDIPDLHQSILKENEKEDDGKIVVYVLKELDDNEVRELFMVCKRFSLMSPDVDDASESLRGASQEARRQIRAIQRRIEMVPQGVGGK
jgi:hypothetical protein